MAYFKARVSSSGGAETPTLLYTNPDPSTAHSTDWPDILVDNLSQYKAFMFEVKKYYRDSNNAKDYYWVDSSDLVDKRCIVSTAYSERYFCYRPMYINYTSNKIHSNGKGPTIMDTVNVTIQNGGGYCEILRIWGYKNSIINI